MPREDRQRGKATDAQGKPPAAPRLFCWAARRSRRPGLAHAGRTGKLELIRGIELPADLFDQRHRATWNAAAARIGRGSRDLADIPMERALTWLAAFVYLRARSPTDDLVDLLIETIHQIGARAERKVERELLEDPSVSGKQNLLFNLADATLAQPDGVVRDVVFPVVGEQMLRDLVRWKATGPTYRITLRTVIRNSYQGHYRRMVPTLLAALEFRSNNDRHRPVMDALDLVKRFADTKVHTFPADMEVPLDGVVRGLWREAVMEGRRRPGSGQPRHL